MVVYLYSWSRKVVLDIIMVFCLSLYSTGLKLLQQLVLHPGMLLHRISI